MTSYLQELFTFLKNPTVEKDENTQFGYRIQKFGYLLAISLATSFLLTPIFALIEQTGLVNMDKHAMEEMMESFSKPMLFFLVVIIAPFFEELIFRGPITLFKNSKYFKSIFYGIAILFGLIHITNFDITQNVLLVSPLLVAPQICLGAYFGFIRVRFGLVWSMAIHACYNGILMGITLFVDMPV